jgi:hypothetical protein
MLQLSFQLLDGFSHSGLPRQDSCHFTAREVGASGVGTPLRRHPLQSEQDPGATRASNGADVSAI